MESGNIILAEGPDDWNAIYHLLKRHNLDSLVSIEREVAGVQEILRGLRVRLRPGVPMSYAIVLDADADVDEDQQFIARWQSIRNRLIECGYVNLPDNPSPEGTVIEDEELPRVGIWLMPNNTERGMLEDFARHLIADGDVLWPYAETCVRSLPEQRFSAVHISKAHIHTWLAWQQEPGKPMGLAIRMGYLRPDAPHAQSFVDWVRRVFDL